MSVGTPVVASSISPHVEISSEAAIFFDPASSEDLAQKLLEVIKDENMRQSFIRKGSEQVKRFSWTKTAEKMLEIFESMK
jgi:glycosyltransferase involved in cell wall biosynthesis